MPTYEKIKYDFKMAKEQADKLEVLADRILATAKKSMESTLNDLSSGWQGESAELYIKKARSVESDMIKTAKDLYTVANNIRKTSRKIYNSEMEAKRIAEKRNGK